MAEDGRLGLAALLRQQLAASREGVGAAGGGSGGAEHLPERLWPVHRLDTVTSGIVLFATSPHVAGLMARSLREKQVVKYYVALSGRKPSKSQGSVVGDMARGRSSAWRLLRSKVDPAVTRFVTRGLPGLRPGLRAFLLRPETGRTHQLRVAMKSLGSPVLGDPLYSSGDAARCEDRAYLHAAAIRMRLPDGSLLQIIDPPSEGDLFRSQGFSDLFSDWFPEGRGADGGVWFDQWPLLTSDGARLTATTEESAGGAPLEESTEAAAGAAAAAQRLAEGAGAAAGSSDGGDDGPFVGV